MGKGQRHSRNAGGMGMEHMTYNEKRALGFGTAKERMGKDSQSNLDSCALCHVTARDPVATPEGVLYDREVILEYILEQKKRIAREIKKWEVAQRESEALESRKQEQKYAADLDRFESLNNSARVLKGRDSLDDGAGGSAESVAKSIKATDFEAQQTAQMKAFWLPSKTPELTKEEELRQRLQKPPTEVQCPITGKKLRLKDLIPVKFKRASEDEDLTKTPVEARYLCPVSHDSLTNNMQLVLIRHTGDVMSEESFKKFVKPDMVWKDKKIKEKDVIKLKKPGSGFAASGGAEAKQFYHLGIGSGLTDLRGQTHGPQSAFGLRMR